MGAVDSSFSGASLSENSWLVMLAIESTLLGLPILLLLFVFRNCENQKCLSARETVGKRNEIVIIVIQEEDILVEQGFFCPPSPANVDGLACESRVVPTRT